MPVPDLTQRNHRPWPIPAGQWTWTQSWLDLLFAHWPVSVGELRPLLPPALEIDTFDDGISGPRAWIGVVPFTMRIRHRYAPPLPTASYFPELNVRTYVRYCGKPGVWFFSLDASSRLAVFAARTFFHLPYFHAAMKADNDGKAVRYRSQRRSRQETQFTATYQPTGEVEYATPGTLEHWLTERYCLFAETAGGDFRCGEIHHPPWPLQPAEANIETNTMLQPLGLELPDTEPLLHYSRAIDVALWPFAAA